MEDGKENVPPKILSAFLCALRALCERIFSPFFEFYGIFVVNVSGA